MAESACAAITRIGSFRFEHKKFEELAELLSYMDTARQLYKVCKRCEKALQALGN
jgi:thymidine kinase